MVPGVAGGGGVSVGETGESDVLADAGGDVEEGGPSSGPVCEGREVNGYILLPQCATMRPTSPTETSASSITYGAMSTTSETIEIRAKKMPPTSFLYLV